MRLSTMTAAAILAGTLIGSVAAAPIGFSHQNLVRPHARTSGNCPAWPAGSGILPDGDFSQAVEPSGNELYGLVKGTVFAPDWIVTGPRTIDFQGLNAVWVGPSGVCSVDLDGTPGPGGVRHSTFQTKPGATYTVTFEMSANCAGPPVVKKMLIEAGKGAFTEFAWDTSTGQCAQSGNWASESWQFKASKRNTPLHFESEDPRGNWGPVVAAISVTQN